MARGDRRHRLGTAARNGLRRRLLVANRGLPGLGRSTAFFASAIGGASEMVLLAERHGARIDLVVSAHSLRLLMVVVLVPFGFQLAGLHGLDPTAPGPRHIDPLGLLMLSTACLAGALVMERLRLSNPWVLGPLTVALALTAGGVELSALPRWVTNLGQLFIGISLGTRFSSAFVHTAPRWLTTVAAGTLAMMGLSGGYAWIVASLANLHPATLMLGTAPGGVAEMSLTAKALQLGVPVVTALHVTRCRRSCCSPGRCSASPTGAPAADAPRGLELITRPAPDLSRQSVLDRRRRVRASNNSRMPTSRGPGTTSNASPG